MPDDKGKLYLYEALELRNEYDRHIRLLERLIAGEQNDTESYFRNKTEDEKEPASDFKAKELEEHLKKLQTKRVKLNQAIQVANFEYEIDFEGEKVSIAEALEIRKNLLTDSEAVSQRVSNSAYKRIIHKEERDIVHEPKHAFKESYEGYLDILRKLREIANKIHVVNHKSIVAFREE